MNATWILVLFFGMLMVLNMSSAYVDDQWLGQEAEFENRQPQKRSESLNLIFFFLFILCRYMYRVFVKEPEENLLFTP